MKEEGKRLEWADAGRRGPEWPYADIVDLPHHVSSKHPQMEMSKRAAQFAPFAALTGFEEAIEESERESRPQRSR